MNYKLDTKKAKAGDRTGSNKIDVTGAYIGIISVMKEVVSSKKATNGLEFTFKTEGGESARFLSLWIKSADGTFLAGYDQFNALMCCMKVKQANPKMMPVTEYDFAQGQDVTNQESCLPEMMNKPIGLILQREEYLKNDGSVGSKMVFFSSFEPATRKTAIEMIDNVSAERVDKILSTLKDRKISQADQYQAGANADAATANPVGDNVVEDYDDIPF